MPEPTIPTPDAIPATSDPGDETARRYRYQWTFAAIVCCMLLDDTQDVIEVFCEHHEDVLIKHADATFTGLQVKTRESDQEIWKAKDPAVLSSCARFVKLEAAFPNRFRAFKFLTNHPLHSAGNGQDLCHVLGMIQAASAIADLPIYVMSFIEKVAKGARCSKDMVFNTLSKTRASDDLPKFHDIVARLVSTLTYTWMDAEECTYDSLKQAARALANECGQASSLAHEDILPAYLPVVSSPQDAEKAVRLAGKCIDKARVLDILNRGLNETALLEGNSESWPEPGRITSDLLLKKLEAGGFYAVSLNSAKDLRDKADYLSIRWTKKYGRTPGLRRYDHILSLVLSDAAKAFEVARSEDKLFGIQMLSELHARFEQRRLDGSQLFDCTKEHLEGFVYILTSECKVEWSLDRPWEAQ